MWVDDGARGPERAGFVRDNGSESKGGLMVGIAVAMLARASSREGSGAPSPCAVDRLR